MNSKILFREASEEDSFDLAMMRWDCSLEEGIVPNVDKTVFIQSCASQIIHGIASEKWVCFVAEEENQIVSHAFCYYVPKIPRPDHVIDAIGYVTNVYTKPEYRGKGFGTEILLRIKEWALKTNLELLFVWPSQESYAFYEKAGFILAENIFVQKLR